MDLRELTTEDKGIYNDFVAGSNMGHFIQSWEWGEFKTLQGTPAHRYGVFNEKKLVATAQVTIHRVPKTNFKIAYLPKGPVVLGDAKKILPVFVDGFRQLADAENLIFLKAEPKVESGQGWEEILTKNGFKRSNKWLFTEYNFVVDLKGTEEEVFSRVRRSTRYNIKLAARKGVETAESSDTAEFETFIKLQKLTAKRQNFLVHANSYYRDAFAELKKHNMAHFLVGRIKGKVVAALVAWHFGKTIYYSYSAYDTDYRDSKPMDALIWKMIQVGRDLGCETLDMWGAANPELGEKQAIWGSHQFKESFGPKLEHFVGPYDLPFKPLLYAAFTKLYPLALKVLAWAS